MPKKADRRRQRVAPSRSAEGRARKKAEHGASLRKPVTPAGGVDITTKMRCKGATRYGDPCRFWAMPNSDFCYWCEQAGRPRYPLPKLTGEAARAASTKEVHKRRCKGVTVFGDQCRFWAVGAGEYCLWCLRQRALAAEPTATD